MLLKNIVRIIIAQLISIAIIINKHPYPKTTPPPTPLSPCIKKANAIILNTNCAPYVNTCWYFGLFCAFRCIFVRNAINHQRDPAYDPFSEAFHHTNVSAHTVTEVISIYDQEFSHLPELCYLWSTEAQSRSFWFDTGKCIYVRTTHTRTRILYGKEIFLFVECRSSMCI